MVTQNLKRITQSLILLLVVACSDNNNPALESIPVEIVVSTGFASASGVETRGVQTRGEGAVDRERILNRALPISMVRIDQVSESDASYPPYTQENVSGQGQAPRNGYLAQFESGIRMHFELLEKYLSREANNQTKLIGWYPAVGTRGSSWSVAASGGGADGTDPVATVGFTVDGETDILMSNLVEGDQSHPYTGVSANGESNVMTFKHLLTRVRILAYTYDADAAAVFGRIRSITVPGKAQTCTVRLPEVDAPSNTNPEDSDITFTGSGALPIIYRYPENNTPIPDYEKFKAIPVPVIERWTKPGDAGDPNTGVMGYAMVAPETNEITFLVETEGRGTYTLRTAAPAGGFAAGKSYTLSLEFLILENIGFINLSAQDWKEGITTGVIQG